jgi:hypothetical protein
LSVSFATFELVCKDKSVSALSGKPEQAQGAADGMFGEGGDADETTEQAA